MVHTYLLCSWAGDTHVPMLPQELKEETRHRISRNPEVLMGRHYLTKLALLHCRSTGRVKTFDELIPAKRAAPLESRGPDYDSDDGLDVTQLLKKGQQLRSGRPATQEGVDREAAEAVARSFVAVELAATGQQLQQATLQAAAAQQAAQRQLLQAEVHQLRAASERLQLWQADGALQRALIWRHKQANKCGQEVVSSLSDTSSTSRKGHYVLFRFEGQPWVATVQHFLRLKPAAQDAGLGGQQQLRLAVVRLFQRMEQPCNGMHVVRTSQMQRRRAFSVDSIERTLASAAPPAGQRGHGKVYLMESNASSKL